MKIPYHKDAINRRLYKNQSFVETAIYRVFSAKPIYRVFSATKDPKNTTGLTQTIAQTMILR